VCKGRWENIFEFSGGGDHYEKQPAGLFLKGIKARVSVAGFIKYFPNGLAHPLVRFLFSPSRIEEIHWLAACGFFTLQ